MLVLDDLHWADQASLLLLEFLARELSGSRSLVVGAYRDVELSRQHPLSQTLAQLSREAVYQRHPLRGLDPKDTGPFVDAIAGIQFSQEMSETLYAHTEGNPFFLTEVIRLLAERHQLESAGASGSLDIRVPEGVREVIGQRLNRLSEQCNHALTTASLIGREFDFKVLIGLSEDGTEDQVLEALEEALAARVIEEPPGTSGLYQFTHALIQETLAQELSTTRRARLHARIAELLEGLYGDSAETHSAELDHHFAEAELVLGAAKLVHYSLLAGERALAAYAHEDALAHFERGLGARDIPLSGTEAPSDEEAADLLFGLGRAQAATLLRQELGQAVAFLGRAFSYYAENREVDRAVDVAEHPLAGMGFGRPSGMGPMIEKALEMVRSDSHEAGRLLSRYGRVLGMEQGDYQGAADAFGLALTIARREGDTSLEMRTLNLGANVDVFHLRQVEALEKSRKATELATQSGELTTEVPARFWAACAMRAIGDLEDEERNLGDLLDAAERLGDRYWLVSALWRSETASSLRGE